MPVIHPAPKNIIVGYAKSDKIGPDLRNSSVMLFLYQDGAENPRSAQRRTSFRHVLQGDALIVNVVDQQYRLPGQLQMWSLQPFKLTTTLGAPIATHLAIIHSKIAAEHSGKPYHRDHATHHDPDQNAVIVRHERLQLSRQALISVLDFSFRGNNDSVRKGAQRKSTIQYQRRWPARIEDACRRLLPLSRIAQAAARPGQRMWSQGDQPNLTARVFDVPQLIQRL